MLTAKLFLLLIDSFDLTVDKDSNYLADKSNNLNKQFNVLWFDKHARAAKKQEILF